MKTNFSSETSLRVRYGETDQMGYSYYGNYAQYFEVGRVEALRALGISYKTLESQDVMLPVSEFNVRYKKPAMYDDELLICTKIVAINGSRIHFEYTITNETGNLICEGLTTLVFIAKSTMKPIRPPANFMAIVRPFEVKTDG
ncbi:MAG: acyl-CoA thioester hydrolase [Flavobacteriaceae bacterium]|jgi:acyl-CoA thioester hydrolase